MIEKYKEWCKLTKRNGSVLVGSSILEFFQWLESEGYYLEKYAELSTESKKAIENSLYIDHGVQTHKKSRFQEKLDNYMDKLKKT